MLYSLRQFKPYPISVYWLVEGYPYSGYSGLSKPSINLAKKMAPPLPINNVSSSSHDTGRHGTVMSRVDCVSPRDHCQARHRACKGRIDNASAVNKKQGRPKTNDMKRYAYPIYPVIICYRFVPIQKS